MYLFFDNVPSNPKAEIRLLKLPSPSEPGARWCRICTTLLRPGLKNICQSIKIVLCFIGSGNSGCGTGCSGRTWIGIWWKVGSESVFLKEIGFGFVFGKRSNLERCWIRGNVPFRPYIFIPGIQGQLKLWSWKSGCGYESWCFGRIRFWKQVKSRELLNPR